jgi:ABC-2 type transport system ATP-binding protein
MWTAGVRLNVSRHLVAVEMADAESTDEQRADEALLSIENIEQSFGTVAALDGVSFDITDDTVTAIVGPNGSGKTTLSRIITGLSQPTRGDVSLRTSAERPIGYLPQEPQFHPAFTVEETLQFYADLLSATTDPETVMEHVGLAAIRNRQVDALSGGMRRLLGIAQSILGTPPLVVLDEPTSGLDPRMTRQIFDVITTQTTNEQSILLTTHDLTYAQEADSLVVLDHGRIVAHGPPEKLLAQTNTKSLHDAFFSIVGMEPAVQTGRKEPDQRP